MLRLRRVVVSSALFICTWSASAARAQDVSRTGSELTAQERALAISLAEEEVAGRGLRSTGPMFVTDVELIRTKDGRGEESPDRQALVTHYRYQGDLAILSAVSLSRGIVLQVDTAAHIPTRLATEEFDNARRLALADGLVRSSVEPYLERLDVEALVLHTSNPQDSLFGQRIVRLLFRVGRDYLSDPIVYVNLHQERVSVERRR